MKQNHQPFTPEAATDEPPSLPTAHGPARPDPDLTRDGAAPGLTSDALAEAFVPVATDSLGRAIRRDGFTPARQRLFLSALAACGVAADACRAAGISRDTAYNLRHRAEGRAFAIAWDAAILISRGRMGDELMSRGMNGVVDRIYRNGELWGERHRHDNRLAMAILTRLDRQAEGLGEGAATARTIAQEWEQFLDIVEAGGDGAEDFLRLRARPDVKEPAAILDRDPPPDRETAILARLDWYREFGVGLPAEISVRDCPPEEMESWTEEQWERASSSGLLDILPEDEWPEAARQATEIETNGTCPTRQDMPRLLWEYSLRFPPPELAPGCFTDGFAIWDEEDGFSVTNFPPPEGFAGHEEGEWGDDDYKRALSPEEQEALDRDLAIAAAEEEAERARELAKARAARDRAFGFADSLQSSLSQGDGEGDRVQRGGGATSPVEDAAGSSIQSEDNIREGDSG